MSRYVLDHGHFEICIGYDPPFDSYFAQVFDAREDEESPKRDVLWSGGADGQFYSRPEDVIDLVRPYAPEFDERSFSAAMRADRINGDGQTTYVLVDGKPTPEHLAHLMTNHPSPEDEAESHKLKAARAAFSQLAYNIRPDIASAPGGSVLITTQKNSERRGWHKQANATQQEGAVRSVDPITILNAVLDRLTGNGPTFSAHDLDAVLAHQGIAGQNRVRMTNDILKSDAVVGLREDAHGEVTRYTTRRVIEAESATRTAASDLFATSGHGVSQKNTDGIAIKENLNASQSAALALLTDKQGLGLLCSYPGEGHDTMISAVRQAYEMEGRPVIGLSSTLAGAVHMNAEGFGWAETTKNFALRVEQKELLPKKAVLIIDEAASVHAGELAQILRYAAANDGKVILAGHAGQLERGEIGGVMEVLSERHPTAVLAPPDEGADLAAAAGNFRPILNAISSEANLHWSPTHVDAVKELAQQYAADSAARPEMTRYIFTATAVEAAAFNDGVCELRHLRGELGPDHIVATAYGNEAFATGDLVHFPNGLHPSLSPGEANGAAASITAIEAENGSTRFTVALDAATGDQPRELTFTVGPDRDKGQIDDFRLGYAGTSYQGGEQAPDEAYVLHSRHWRLEPALDSLTTHQDSVHLFVARETAADFEALATMLGRADEGRPASSYVFAEQEAREEEALSKDEAEAPALETPRQNIDPSQPDRPVETMTESHEPIEVRDASETRSAQEERKALFQELERVFGRVVGEQEGREACQGLSSGLSI